MILAYPVLLAAAAALAVSRRGEPSGRGHRWFAAWTLAGGLFTFSFLTGLSIGLLLLPLATVALLGAAWASPHGREALGFGAGLGTVLLLVAFVNREGDGVDPAPWLVAGTAVVVGASAAYALATRDAARRSRGRASAARPRRPGSTPPTG